MYYYLTSLWGCFIPCSEQDTQRSIQNNSTAFIVISSPEQLNIPRNEESEEFSNYLKVKPFTIVHWPPLTDANESRWLHWNSIFSQIILHKLSLNNPKKPSLPPKKGFAAWINTLESK